MTKFTQQALNLLSANKSRKYYVYRLVDPRTHHTFYVGKGCGNRVFDHINTVKELIEKGEDPYSLKSQLISEIVAAGKKVICFLHRWGLSEKEAFAIESALIDCYPGLANIQAGHDNEHGLISVEDFENLSNMQEYVEPEEDYIIIKTSQNSIQANGSLYEATRRAWAANLNTAKRYKYVLSVIRGVVKEVYVVDDVNGWYKEGDRIAFNGKVATGSISKLKGTLLPEKYRKKGMARPFLYKKK